MAEFISETLSTPVAGAYDIIVAGAGPAGVAAAVTAGRLGAKVLRENGLDAELIGSLVERFVGRGAPGQPAQGLTPRAKRVIELALAEAGRLGHSYVGTEHLLMGILREPDSAATWSSSSKPNPSR